mmetsp:Transcript_89941/g.192880  ORF Transcript_89941/g.192880 Transcript_89941/m.192880 type:complete len:259 (+) Transcript_89941:388-1164(+)
MSGCIRLIPRVEVVWIVLSWARDVLDRPFDWQVASNGDGLWEHWLVIARRREPYWTHPRYLLELLLFWEARVGPRRQCVLECVSARPRWLVGIYAVPRLGPLGVAEEGSLDVRRHRIHGGVVASGPWAHCLPGERGTVASAHGVLLPGADGGSQRILPWASEALLHHRPEGVPEDWRRPGGMEGVVGDILSRPGIGGSGVPHLRPILSAPAPRVDAGVQPLRDLIAFPVQLVRCRPWRGGELHGSTTDAQANRAAKPP